MIDEELEETFSKEILEWEVFATKKDGDLIIRFRTREEEQRIGPVRRHQVNRKMVLAPAEPGRNFKGLATFRGGYFEYDILMLKLVDGAIWTLTAPLWVPFMAFLLAEVPNAVFFSPVFDLFGRIVGNGARRRGEPGFFGAPDAIKDNYFLNLLDWFGWFIPGYPMVVSEARAIDEIIPGTEEVFRHPPIRSTRRRHPGPLIVLKTHDLHLGGRELSSFEYEPSQWLLTVKAPPTELLLAETLAISLIRKGTGEEVFSRSVRIE